MSMSINMSTKGRKSRIRMRSRWLGVLGGLNPLPLALKVYRYLESTSRFRRIR